MPNYLHRTTKRLLNSIPPTELPEAEANYILAPDLLSVAGQPVKYWVITGDVVSLADQATRDAIDAAELTASRDDVINNEIDNLEGVVRAFAQVMMDEINILRAEHSLPDRTLAQLKTAIRNKVGS